MRLGKLRIQALWQRARRAMTRLLPHPRVASCATIPEVVESTVTPQPTVVVRQSPVAGGSLPRTHTWHYGGRDWIAELQIPEPLYRHYQSMAGLPTDNYSVYAIHPSDEEYIRTLTSALEITAAQEGWGHVQTAEFVVSFVQHHPYIVHPVTTSVDDCPRYPVETLVDGGNCEDTSILLAALLRSMGYDAVLISFSQTPDSIGHCGIGIQGYEGMNGMYYELDGERYFYVETTAAGWKIGELPEQYRGPHAKLYRMTDPILTLGWNAKSSRRTALGQVLEHTVNLDVTVENIGGAAADAVHALAGFDAGGSRVWNSEESEIFKLPPGQCTTIPLTLQAPIGKHSRLRIQVFYGDDVVDESYSDWFDT